MPIHAETEKYTFTLLDCTECAKEALDLINGFLNRKPIKKAAKKPRPICNNFAVFIENGEITVAPELSEEHFGLRVCVKRFVGVYTKAISITDLADDIRATLYAMPISGVKVL
jgi:hypothetical protein